MINNLENILPLLEWDEEFIYVVDLIFRKKDRFGGRDRVVNSYYLRSEDYLMDKWEDIVRTCDAIGTRAMIYLSPRRARSVALVSLTLLSNIIYHGEYYQASRAYRKAFSRAAPALKRWLVDIDEQPEGDILGELERLQPVGKKDLAIIPSKSGIHIITTPFDLKAFKEIFPHIDVHKDNPTNLYIP